MKSQFSYPKFGSTTLQLASIWWKFGVNMKTEIVQSENKNKNKKPPKYLVINTAIDDIVT
jgi:hypothetical protein